jgi:hypothetical protein
MGTHPSAPLGWGAGTPRKSLWNIIGRNMRRILESLVNNIHRTPLPSEMRTWGVQRLNKVHGELPEAERAGSSGANPEESSQCKEQS